MLNLLRRPPAPAPRLFPSATATPLRARCGKVIARALGPVSAVVLGLSLAGGAVAQTLTEREARAAVPDSRNANVIIADLDWLDAATRRATESYARQFAYYAALAVSPGDPQSTGSAVAVADHHSPQDAQRAALDACNARRTTGQPCVIVATVVPRGYDPSPLTLSKSGVAAFKGDFRRLSAPKAFAISPATGQFGFARGDGGRALSTCNARAQEGGARDCKIVVAD